MGEYIVTKRARITTLAGEVNLPYGTALAERDGWLLHDGKILFRTNSEHAFRYTACNDDGLGRERGALIHAIKNKLAKRDAAYQKRWDRLWGDPLARSFKMEDTPEEYFLWGFKFYNAPIADLEYIAALIGVKKEYEYV